MRHDRRRLTGVRVSFGRGESLWNSIGMEELGMLVAGAHRVTVLGLGAAGKRLGRSRSMATGLYLVTDCVPYLCRDVLFRIESDSAANVENQCGRGRKSCLGRH